MLASIFTLIAVLGFSQDRLVQIAFETESGALKILHHTYKVGESGSTFNFVTQGARRFFFPLSELPHRQSSSSATKFAFCN